MLDVGLSNARRVARSLDAYLAWAPVAGTRGLADRCCHLGAHDPTTKEECEMKYTLLAEVGIEFAAIQERALYVEGLHPTEDLRTFLTRIF